MDEGRSATHPNRAPSNSKEIASQGSRTKRQDYQTTSFKIKQQRSPLLSFEGSRETREGNQHKSTETPGNNEANLNY